MSVLITGSPFTGKKLLAEGLSHALGYRSVGDDVVVEKAAAFGGSHADLRDMLRTPPTIRSKFDSRATRMVDLLRAALLDELAFDVDRLLERLAVGDLRGARDGIHLELADQARANHLEVKLTHAGNDG